MGTRMLSAMKVKILENSFGNLLRLVWEKFFFFMFEIGFLLKNRVFPMFFYTHTHPTKPHRHSHTPHKPHTYLNTSHKHLHTLTTTPHPLTNLTHTPQTLRRIPQKLTRTKTDPTNIHTYSQPSHKHSQHPTKEILKQTLTITSKQLLNLNQYWLVRSSRP